MTKENNLLKIAFNEFNNKNFQEAIEAFNKSLALHENWQSYQGLGFALHHTNQNQQAIEAFNKSLTLNENWQSYQGLGFALHVTNQHQQAIEAFEKSLTLNQNWQSYQGLGLALHHTNQNQQAIEAFNKSLTLNENWRSYQGLGLALHHTNQNQQAIEAFNKSLTLNENWRSYLGLGLALHHTNQNQQAIEAFNKSLALHENWQSYLGLGLALHHTNQNQQAYERLLTGIKLSFNTNNTNFWTTGQEYPYLANVLNGLGRAEQAKRAYQIYFRQSDDVPHKKIDPFLGIKDGITVTRDLIENISENLSSLGFSFHPSFLSESIKDDQLQSWKHLIYIHIQKCAGTSFLQPINMMMKYLHFAQDSIPRSSSEFKHYLWQNDLGGEISKHSAYLLEAFQSKSLDDIQASFFSNHGGKHGIYDQHLRQAGISAKKICLTRDPSQRLLSHIRHKGRIESSKTTLLNKFRKTFSNAIDKYIYDYDLFDDYSESPHCNPFDYKKCETIDFLDISDNDAISKVKSSFLSAALLPNIINPNRLNEGKNKAKGTLQEKDFQEIHKMCISQGFLERDAQIDLEFLKRRTKERLVFPKIIQNGVNLHPLTFVHTRHGSSRLILTKDFIANPLSIISC